MSTAGKPVIRLHPADNVVVARTDLPAGASLADEGIAVRDRVPSGHKIATAPIARDEAVRRYGQIIGFASSDIPAGAHVHTHNCEIRDFQRDYAHGTLAEGELWRVGPFNRQRRNRLWVVEIGQPLTPKR